MYYQPVMRNSTSGKRLSNKCDSLLSTYLAAKEGLVSYGWIIKEINIEKKVSLV